MKSLFTGYIAESILCPFIMAGSGIEEGLPLWIDHQKVFHSSGNPLGYAVVNSYIREELRIRLDNSFTFVVYESILKFIFERHFSSYREFLVNYSIIYFVFCRIRDPDNITYWFIEVVHKREVKKPPVYHLSDSATI